MKKIAFNLSKDFHLHPISVNKVYELESNSTELLFNTIVEPDMAYELHVETEKEKFYKVLDKKENYISLVMSNAVLAKSGEMKIQVKGVSINHDTNEETVLISNAFLITVGSFINAKFEPTPEEMDEFEKLVVRVEEIDSRITQLVSNIGEIASDLENERTERLAAESELEEQIELEVEERKQVDNEQNTALNSLAQSVSEIIVELAQKAPASVLETISVILAAIETLENIKADKSSVYDKSQTNALLDQKAGTGDLSALNTLLRAEIAKKQNTLIPGANIKIENDVISATGGGGEGDVTKEYLEQNYYNKLFFDETVTLEETGDSTEVSSADIVYQGLVNPSKVLTDEEKLNIETWLGLSENYLTYYNNTPYVVDENYIPAHKKYVDDKVESINEYKTSSSEPYIIGKLGNKTLYRKFITGVATSTLNIQGALPENANCIDVKGFVKTEVDGGRTVLLGTHLDDYWMFTRGLITSSGDLSAFYVGNHLVGRMYYLWIDYAV